MAADRDGGKAGGGSMGQLVGALVVVTLLAAGGGGFVAYRSLPRSAAPAAGSAAAQPAVQGAEGAAASAALPMTVVDIPAVITNLKTPTDVWVRLETSMIFERGPDRNPDVVSGQLASDFLAYMRTLALTDLESPDGLVELRADLDERAVTRSKGAVKDILIRTLVVQ